MNDTTQVPAHAPPRPWTVKEQQRCAELRKAGLTLRQIGARLGRSEGAVSAVLHQLRMQRRQPWRRRGRGKLGHAVLIMEGLGHGKGEIADRLGVAVRTVLRAKARARKNQQTGKCTDPTTPEDRTLMARARRKAKGTAA
jgi:DNA-binding CsgD family transcriptional regulator